MSNCRSSLVTLLVGVILAAAAQSTAHAQTKTLPDEYSRIIRATEQVEPLDDEMFGEKVSLYNGATEFSVVDIDLPGNNALPVRLVRRYVVEDRQTPGYLGGMGEWDVDVPYIKGMFAASVGWQVGGANPNARCSNPSSPLGTSGVSPEAFFHGYSLHVPGSGDQSLLGRKASTPAGPTNVGTSTIVTKGNWHISCLAGTKNGYAGEAFVARSPDGVNYYFDYVITKAAGNISPTGYFSGGVYYGGSGTARNSIYFAASRVEDRFGNWVKYDYTGSNLTSITSSDGRSITVHYVSGLADYASAHGLTVNYTYTSGKLTSVKRPDNTYWRYSNPGFPAKYAIKSEYEPKPLPTYNGCMFDFATGEGPQSFTITHPSGAEAVYTFGIKTHKRSHVVRACMPTTGTPGYFKYPPWSNSWSILSRVVSGPGLSPATRTYDYPVQAYLPWAACTTCPTSKFIVQHEPDGRTITHEFGITYNENEGQLLSTTISDVAGTIVRTTINEYVANSEVSLHPFSASMGYDFNSRADDFGAEEVRPLKSTRIEQDGETFTMEVKDFDIYAHPVCQKKYSSLGYTKYELTSYAANTAKWVLDLVDTVTVGPDCSGSGFVSFDNDYDSNGLVTSFSRFGALVQSYTYAPDGTLSTVSDALNHVTSASSWHRGVPRLLEMPGGGKMSATVGDFGQVLTVDDELNSRTCYAYDYGLRLKTVTYTSETQAQTCDVSTWGERGRTTVQVQYDEYGIPANHWRTTDGTGSGLTTTFYDALFRPIVVLTEDITNTATRSYVVRRYDNSGNKIFESYPVSTLGSFSDPLFGVRTNYDGLGRPIRVQQDIEGGAVANTDTIYLNGFRTQVTNPRGNVTTTGFQAYDQPATDMPIRVDMPEGVSTTYHRQPELAKVLRVTRTGPFNGTNVGAVRRYVYDANQRLCETIDPEAGATIVSYDAQGNVTWGADGQPSSIDLPSGRSDAQICADDRAAVADASKITRSYDPMNREISRSSVGGSENSATKYYLDGQVNVRTASNPGNNPVVTTYSYNRRRLLTSEVLQITPSVAWTFGYGYNASGHVSSQTYPGGLVIGYAPDGLGRPTQAGSFATGVTYFPNGAVKGFTYGNGIIHSMTQNTRLLPARSIDSFTSEGATTKILDDSYIYDANGNVLGLTDASNVSPAENRTWGVLAPTIYDGLDRLIAARSTNQWGAIDFDGYNASYSYDPMDNLRTNNLGASSLFYSYDAGNRLVQLSNGMTSWTVSTDNRGNVTANSMRGQAYQFDLAHRMSAVVGKEAYLYDGNGRRVRTTNLQTNSIEYYAYAQDGRLLQDWSNRRGVRNGYVYLGSSVVGMYEVNIANGLGTITQKYQHTDAIGSPIVSTTKGALPSDPPVVIGRVSYSPFGLPATPVDGVGFTGHFTDVGTLLTYMQQRYYDPTLGRFLAVDPLPFNVDAPWNFNRYYYALNNPFRFTDPDGRDPQPEPRVSEVTTERPVKGEGIMVERRVITDAGINDQKTEEAGSVQLLPQASANGAPAEVGDKVMNRLLNFSEEEGKTVQVTSGQRTTEQNRAVGGAKKSQHLQDNAADIRIKGNTKEQTADAAERSGEFNRVNKYPDSRGVHVDLKETGNQGRFNNWVPAKK